MLVIQATQSNQHRRVDMFLKLKRMAIKIRGEYLSSCFSKKTYIRILTTINIQAEFRQIKSRLLHNHFYTITFTLIPFTQKNEHAESQRCYTSVRKTHRAENITPERTSVKNNTAMML